MIVVFQPLEVQYQQSLITQSDSDLQSSKLVYNSSSDTQALEIQSKINPDPNLSNTFRPCQPIKLLQG
ncbi:hypothetical protein pb186bvf_007885 [Paramecium bursaria]